MKTTKRPRALKPLEGMIAVVAGATRGAGRGIACALGESGATVYCTGRSTRTEKKALPASTVDPFENANRPETIEETAELVTARGGRGIPLRVDHTREDEVRELFHRIQTDQKRLDVLVNDVWGGDALTEWQKPFWESSLDKGLQMLRQAVHSHIITSRYAVPIMVPRRRGLIVEITDGDTLAYRGNLFYDLVKVSVIRIAFSMAHELKKHRITAVAVTPGFLRSEAMLEYFGVGEENWQDGIKKDPAFASSETPLFVGRAIAALAADSKVFKKTGGVFSSWKLAHEYKFTDVDGRRPDMGKYFDDLIKHEGWFREMIETHYTFVNAFTLPK